VDREGDQATAFLEDILSGETDWRLSDVQRLLELHTLVALGRVYAMAADSRIGGERSR
jgi:hypothetical protein